jgi:hypothetical protein
MLCRNHLFLFLTYYVACEAMAGLLGRFRLPAQNGLVQVQRVKVRAKSRYLLSVEHTILKTDCFSLGTFFLRTTAVAFVLFCPLPERIFLQKHRKPLDSEYGELWQKEHRRQEQLNQHPQNPESASDLAEVSDDGNTQTGAIFIPMTWLTKREREYYSGTDPEWQEFVALSKDPERMRAIKSKLAGTMCRHVSRIPEITRLTGKPLAVDVSWLDFHFPSLAPAEYERSGLLWTDDGVTWVTRKFDDRQAKRVYRVLFPMALFSSLQTLSTTLWTSHYESLKGLWSGRENKDPQASANLSIQKPVPPAAAQQESKSTSLVSIQRRPTPSQQSMSLALTGGFQAQIIRNIMPEPQPNSIIAGASKAFRLNFLSRWSTAQAFHPRGACAVKGEVGMNGPKGRCKISVSAVYLPKEDVFLYIGGDNLDIWEHSQAPRGTSKPQDPPKT